MRRKIAGVAAALTIELLFVLLLLSLGVGMGEEDRETVAITAVDVRDATPQEDAGTPEPDEPAANRPEPSESQPDETPLEITPPTSAPLPSELPIPVTPAPPQPAPTPTPSPTRSSRIGAVIRSDSSYGPADTGPARGADSAIVGTAPDGSPLYAASWYREPYDSELSGYLSAANSSGWGLIACKTAPNWRVEDCEIIEEYPNGSGIAHATQQAAWQFQVRPPRVGGTYQVGSWVRIRITYTYSPRRSAFGTR